MMPFVVSNSTEFLSDDEIKIHLALCDVDVMVKKGRDVYIDAVVKVFASASECKSAVVVSDVELADELTPKDAGIEIYFAKGGDDIWDIAKQLKVKPEIVEKQNQDLTFPLEKDENIAIYYN